MKILQVHSNDLGGGAEEMAYLLHREFRRLGHEAALVVGRSERGGEGVFELPAGQKWKGEFRLKKWLEEKLGLQYLFAPASSRIVQTTPFAPDVVLVHSLHGGGGYFDLADMERLSKRQPTFVYLQDQWLMTGHCAYSLGCERWRAGCGSCPDLSIYPELKKDGTARNFRRKRRMVRRSRLKVGSPARWILGLAKASPILEGFDQYYIPNAVDPEKFFPGDKAEARRKLGLDPAMPMVLFLAQKGSRSAFKDFDTLAEAFRLLRKEGGQATLLTVGGTPDADTLAALPQDVQFRPFSADRALIAEYYRAADIFCHATKADVCPLTIIESQACGTPVIGTAIGGVPEIIVDGVTGSLVPLGDARAMADALKRLLADPVALQRMGKAAASHALPAFGIETIANRFLKMFEAELRACEDPRAVAYPHGPADTEWAP